MGLHVTHVAEGHTIAGLLEHHAALLVSSAIELDIAESAGVVAARVGTRKGGSDASNSAPDSGERAKAATKRLRGEKKEKENTEVHKASEKGE